MAISFLHAADIHLDSPLKGLERYENAPVDRIRGATRRAFTRLVDVAIEKRVDFVLLAGDLYDGDWRDYNTGLFLVHQLRRLRDQGIPVFVIAGNHDADNKMTRILPLPDNVRMLAHDRPETVYIRDLDVAIHGQSYARAAVTENLVAAYPAPVSGCVNIGMLHTGMGGENGHERYAPCTLEELRLRGYNYWALGHVHTRQVLCGDPPVVFAGNAQGRHIRETGPKGCLIATIGADRTVSHVFERLDSVRWHRAHIDLAMVETEADILGRVAESFDDLLASDPEQLVALRVILAGRTSWHGKLQTDPERVLAEIRGLATERGGDRLWIEKLEIETRPLAPVLFPDGPFEELRSVLNELRHDPGAMASIIDELGELRRRLPAEVVHDPDTPRLDDPLWLQTLLERVDPLLLDLLLTSTGTEALTQATSGRH